MPDDVPCAVCLAPGTLKCSRCRSTRFCGPEHQALLWSSHKLLCKPNAPLVFRGRRLRDSEVQAFIDSPATLEMIGFVVESGATSEEEAKENFGLARTRERWAKLSPTELEENTNLVLAINATLENPPHAAFAYTTWALCDNASIDRLPGSQSAKLGQIGRSLGLSGDMEETTGLVSILDAADDLVDIALDRLGDLSEGLEVAGRELVRFIREKRSRG
ncbi:hypothetical protein RQP46_008901 [Phenoliferia psychrophenolica]